MTDVTEEDLRAYREEAEATRDQPMPSDAARPGFTRAKVLSVRLNPEEFTELTRYAAQVDVPPSALVRGWILSHLRQDDDATPASTVERIAREVEHLRRQIAEPKEPKPKRKRRSEEITERARNKRSA
jgi:hypothetical protein